MSAQTLTLQYVQDRVSAYMTAILDLFIPGAQITVIVRQPDDADGKMDFMLTSDDLRQAAKVISRQGKLLSQAAQDVLDERHRQTEVEGWTPEHDDGHVEGQISDAAAAYAYGASRSIENKDKHPPNFWPWTNNWWKPTTTRRDLIKAGALIIAEIERLDRAAAKEGGAS